MSFTKKVVILLLVISCKSLFAQDPLYLDSTASVDDRVEDLLGRMTLEEKVGQMMQAERGSVALAHISSYYLGSVFSGGGSRPPNDTPKGWADMYDTFQSQALSTRLGIPIIYGIDAVHGHNTVYGAVIFPHNIGLGCTRDSNLVEKAARITAVEVNATGLDWTFAPYTSVARNERWGRTYECFSETPELAATMAAAAVRGFQGDTLANYTSIVACAKAFIADGACSTDASNAQDAPNAQIDEATLRAVHLPSFIEVIKQNVGTIMPATSKWNGTLCHENYYLLTTLLKDELGFQGFIISDWNRNTPEGIKAGIDMCMAPYDYIALYNSIIKLVNQKDISEDRINDAVRRILRIKFKMGLFEHPYADRSLLDSLGTDAHRAVAREAVRKSLVLLKKKDGILPLPKENMHLFVTGSNADNLGYQCGGWTSSWQGGSGDITIGTTILEAIQQEAPGLEITYSESGFVNDATVDVALVVIGEESYAEEIGDRTNLNLTLSDISLIRNLKQAGLPVIVILISGRPLIIDAIIPYTDALIAAWLPGTEGNGITDVLFGDYNPSGLLSYTWPRKMKDIPINVGDEAYDPLFAYGHGITDLADSPTGSAPLFYSAAVNLNGVKIYIAFNKPMAEPAGATTQFTIRQNDQNDISIGNIAVDALDSTTLILTLSDTLSQGDEVSISYSGESVFSKDGGQLGIFGPEYVYNRLDEDCELFSIPGRIEAEDYAYMSDVSTKRTDDISGGRHVRMMKNECWMVYYFDIPYSGEYYTRFRIASSSNGGTLYLKKGIDTLATIMIPVTGDWGTWTNVAEYIYLEAGVYEIMLDAGEAGFYLNWFQFYKSAGIDKQTNTIFSYQLQQNYPNPFNPVTRINYQIPMTCKVDLSIYNLLGQKMVTLVLEKQKAGHHQVEWDASGFASGIYYYMIKAGEFRQVKKMVLVQ